MYEVANEVARTMKELGEAFAELAKLVKKLEEGNH